MKSMTDFMKLKRLGCPLIRGASAGSQIFTMSLYSAPVHCPHTGKFISKLAYVREVRNNGKLFIYQGQTLFLDKKTFQKSNCPFAGVIINEPSSSCCNRSKFIQLYILEPAWASVKFGRSANFHSPTSSAAVVEK